MFGRLETLFVSRRHRLSTRRYLILDILVSITVREASPAVIVLAQVDNRYFREVMGSEWWTFDFVIYRKGDKEALTFSSPAPLHARSVNTEVDLDPGTYIVHVRFSFVNVLIIS
jgi:hypothetical protein